MSAGETTMKKHFIFFLVLATAATLTASGAPAQIPTKAQTPGFLAGNIKIPAEDTLAAREVTARREASGAGYFTAWMFESRNKVHRGGKSKIMETFTVGAEGAKIKARSRDESAANNLSTGGKNDEPAPAALLLLYDSAGAVVDASVLDPDNTYEFGPTPLFWLGQAANDESVARIESLFDLAKQENLKTTLVFLASLHTGPRGYGFVRSVAMGSEPVKVREQAVFWLGVSREERSLADLKAVYAKEKAESVKKQIVFALQLKKSPEATRELIALAKTEPDPEIKKTAVFWLGQMASEESVKALKDIVRDKDGEEGVREQAVFAISRMPKEKSVPALIEIAKTNASPEVRKRAIFWLAQSGDAAAIKLFEEILLKK
jgi:HEAT repeat protein